MGFWNSILNVPRRWFEPRVYHLGAREMIAEVDNMSAAKMFRTQPHLRTVVTFLARSIAQLGLHSYQLEADGGRARDRSSAAVKLINAPNPYMTTYQLVFALVADKALYDRAYWWHRVTDEGTDELYRIPPAWVEPVSGTFGNDRYRLYGVDDEYLELRRDQLIVFEGYAANSLTSCSPTLDALKGVLKEQIEALKYREQLWSRGGRVSAVLERPVDARRWSNEAREAFREDWYAQYTGNGPRAGGTPLLEDGMKLNRIDFSATDQQYIEGVKLGYATVAQAFHVNPTMVGLLENANYSNVREFRKMLYGDTLGPTISEIEAVVNRFLLEKVKAPEGLYFEFNVSEKLQGDFETQAAVLQSAIGVPWMTPNEGRARQNLPAVEGGDVLQLPLNMGGASTDTPDGDETPGSDGQKAALQRVKASTLRATASKAYTRALEAFFDASRLTKGVDVKAAGDPTPPPVEVKELTRLLLSLELEWSSKAAYQLLNGEGLNAEELYSVARTEAYLAKKAKGNASRILEQIMGLLAAKPERGEDEEEITDAEWQDRVMEEVSSSGAKRMGTTMATSAVAWGLVEAGRQYAEREGTTVTKTWRTRSGNPRTSHKRMNGQTREINAKFSNGMKWPGDGNVSDPEEIAGCECEVDINLRRKG